MGLAGVWSAEQLDLFDGNSRHAGDVDEAHVPVQVYSSRPVIRPQRAVQSCRMMQQPELYTAADLHARVSSIEHTACECTSVRPYNRPALMGAQEFSGDEDRGEKTDRHGGV